ncbi:DUF6680 family protein [Chromobacterium sp. IIBBL 290-4]|uniref:DUF6680 family protein n=1 Tax=Chromobacterium sp. IIBBL 290-4 TaxID=2953890 RepID=UPI0020B64CDB|nr:DUF6680 family protein [Chromobacterium sp. IIBBL 290-4]UTH76003.1 hypothetical protein NKT35_07825 [Chromobacterium sp. IIBBL 290-4]
MSVDPVVLETLRVQEIQAWITGVAIILGPLFGVLFTFWFQDRKEKIEAKHQLFIALVAERKAVVSLQVAQSLNKIDIVFSNSPKVRGLWHQYYDLLNQPPSPSRIHKWIELLSAMASDLGYKNLSQVELDKFYTPQGHIDDVEFQQKVAKQWSRVLEGTEHFIVKARQDNKENG